MQRPPKVSFGAPHPDPIVETSSLSAVQPPEPTYDLLIRDEIEDSNALSSLQLETLVYASQVALVTDVMSNMLALDAFLIRFIWFCNRGTCNIFQINQGRDSSLEMALVWAKVELLLD